MILAWRGMPGGELGFRTGLSFPATTWPARSAMHGMEMRRIGNPPHEEGRRRRFPFAPARRRSPEGDATSRSAPAAQRHYGFIRRKEAVRPAMRKDRSAVVSGSAAKSLLAATGAAALRFTRQPPSTVRPSFIGANGAPAMSPLGSSPGNLRCSARPVSQLADPGASRFCTAALFPKPPMMISARGCSTRDDGELGAKAARDGRQPHRGHRSAPHEAYRPWAPQEQAVRTCRV